MKLADGKEAQNVGQQPDWSESRYRDALNTLQANLASDSVGYVFDRRAGDVIVIEMVITGKDASANVDLTVPMIRSLLSQLRVDYTRRQRDLNTRLRHITDVISESGYVAEVES